MNQFNSDVTGIIYNGIVHQTPKNKILGNLANEVRVFSTQLGKLSSITELQLWNLTKKLYTQVSKRAYLEARKPKNGINYQENLENRSIAVFGAVKSIIISPKPVLRALNPLLNALEAQDKNKKSEILMQKEREKAVDVTKILKKAEKSGEVPAAPIKNYHYSPFFLASAHVDPAEDHKNLQGRMYYDAHWEKYVTSEADKAQIKAYIQNHNCLSVQEVMGAPYYFILRPNCTHYFKHMSLEEVLHSSSNKLLKEHRMINHKPHSTPTVSYSRAYEDKLDQLQALWKVMPNPELAKDIKSTKQLNRKWHRLAEQSLRSYSRARL